MQLVTNKERREETSFLLQLVTNKERHDAKIFNE